MPRAVDAGVCPGCSSVTCRPSEAHSFCKPHSSTTFWPTLNTSCRDSMTSHTPRAGTRSPGLSASAESAPGGAHTKGSSASQRARHNRPPFDRRGAGASASSKSPGPIGGRLILICRLSMTPWASCGPHCEAASAARLCSCAWAFAASICCWTRASVCFACLASSTLETPPAAAAAPVSASPHPASNPVKARTASDLSMRTPPVALQMYASEPWAQGRPEELPHLMVTDNSWHYAPPPTATPRNCF